jgi:pimeloyl-ACP methyl ester carboxylesterase
VAASMGAWIATHYAMARPERVERLAMVCPAGIVSPLKTTWSLRVILTVSIRPTRAKIETFVDSMAMEKTRPNLGTDPWRPMVQQLIFGLASYRANM